MIGMSHPARIHSTVDNPVDSDQIRHWIFSLTLLTMLLLWSESFSSFLYKWTISFTFSILLHCCFMVQVNLPPVKLAFKSIVVPEYCSAMHYHECAEFLDPSTHSSPRRLDMTFVNVSYGAMHHYKSCSITKHKPDKCSKLLSNTIVDDTVLRYREELMENVRRVLDIGILQYYNVSTTVPTKNTTVV